MSGLVRLEFVHLDDGEPRVLGVTFTSETNQHYFTPWTPSAEAVAALRLIGQELDNRAHQPPRPDLRVVPTPQSSPAKEEP